MNIEKIMKIARERVFKNFIMSFCEFGALQVIDWHNADNTREYHIRFIFDNEGKTMSVSGDVGSAMFAFPSFDKVTLQTIGKLKDIDYFSSKIQCSTDLYTYDLEEAKADLASQYLHEYDTELSTEEREERERMIQELLEQCFSRSTGITDIPFELSEKLQQIDQDYLYWVSSAGRCIAQRIIYWLTALNMIYEELYQS